MLPKNSGGEFFFLGLNDDGARSWFQRSCLRSQKEPKSFLEGCSSRQALIGNGMMLRRLTVFSEVFECLSLESNIELLY